MPIDIAIDRGTGDLLIAPNGGIEIVSGQASVDQRIRVRLLVYGGEWELDPSGGLLGSRLRTALRLSRRDALQQVPHLVQEALEPMNDINLVDVIAEPDPLNARKIDLTIHYTMVEDTDEESTDVLTTSLTAEG